MNYWKDQRGVALVLGLVLVAIVLAAAGFGIYSVAHNKKPIATAPTPTPTKSASLSPTPAPTKPSNEFDVPELGIKMTLPPGLIGLTYAIDPNHTGSANVTYHFDTARFTTAYLQQHGCTTPGIGAISRYSEDPKKLGVTSSVGTIRQVGDFYLDFNAAQATCGDDATVNGSQTTTMQLLSQAFNSATPL
jgi:hypothetical protein